MPPFNKAKQRSKSKQLAEEKKKKRSKSQEKAAKKKAKKSKKNAPPPPPTPSPPASPTSSSSSESESDGNDSGNEGGGSDSSLQQVVFRGRNAPKSKYSLKIDSKFQHKMWRGVKIIGGEDAKKQATEAMFDLLGLGKKHNNKSEKEQNSVKDNWVKHYGAEVTSICNARRCYVIGQLKKILATYWRENGRKLPPLDKLKACLDRTLDPKNKDDLDIFYIWVDKILPYATGNKFDWSEKVRCKYTISQAAEEEKVDNKGNIAPLDALMSPSTEGFAFAAIDNFYDNLVSQMKWKDDNNNARLPNLKLEKNRDPDRDPAKDPNFAPTKYKDSLQGHVSFSGYHKDGQQAFLEFMQTNETARKTENSKALEAAVLAKLQENHPLPSAAKGKGNKKDDGVPEIVTLCL